ncbi:DUF1542 domain-containing protein, partial [Streptococcus danieliae]|nr:DUF1542 domain-containing protein [Streptococcus danieliae]
TAEEKAAAKAEVDSEAAKAKSAIDAAQTDASVEVEKSAGIAKINAVNPSTESSEKNLLKKDIDAVAAAKKAEIEARNDLTQEEK